MGLTTNDKQQLLQLLSIVAPIGYNVIKDTIEAPAREKAAQVANAVQNLELQKLMQEVGEQQQQSQRPTGIAPEALAGIVPGNFRGLATIPGQEMQGPDQATGRPTLRQPNLIPMDLVKTVIGTGLANQRLDVSKAGQQQAARRATIDEIAQARDAAIAEYDTIKKEVEDVEGQFKKEALLDPKGRAAEQKRIAGLKESLPGLKAEVDRLKVEYNKVRPKASVDPDKAMDAVNTAQAKNISPEIMRGVLKIAKDLKAQGQSPKQIEAALKASKLGLSLEDIKQISAGYDLMDIPDK